MGTTRRGFVQGLGAALAALGLAGLPTFGQAAPQEQPEGQGEELDDGKVRGMVFPLRLPITFKKE